MYLHLGQDTIVRDSDVIGIFDLDITSQSIRTRRYLRTAEQNGEVIAVSEDLPKSFVVTGKRHHQRVYISQLSSATLLRRAESSSVDESLV